MLKKQWRAPKFRGMPNDDKVPAGLVSEIMKRAKWWVFVCNMFRYTNHLHHYTFYHPYIKSNFLLTLGISFYNVTLVTQIDNYKYYVYTLLKP